MNLFDSGPMTLPTLCAIHSPVVEREVATKSPSLSPTLRPPPMSSPVAIRDVNMSASRTTNICVDQQSGRRAKQSPERITDITTADRRKQSNINNEMRPSFSTIMQREGEWKESKKTDEEWTLVQNKRYRNRFISRKASAVVDEKSVQFKAADTKVPLFISNVHKAVSEQDIVDYVYEKTSERVTLVKIKMKQERDYNAYKLFVTRHKMELFLDEKLWPSGISFRRFVHLQSRRRSTEISTEAINENTYIKNG